MKTRMNPNQNEMGRDPVRTGAAKETLSSPGLSVALLGPDGAGKTELVKRIESRFAMPVRTLYMGLYGRSSPARIFRRVPVVRFAVMLSWQWILCLIAGIHRMRSGLVLFDRYAYDALLPQEKPLTIFRRFRRWLLGRSCPTPDLVILLDAPGEVLFARKKEHSPEQLEAQRQGYRGLADQIRGVRIVDASQNAEEVYREVVGLIREGLARRGRDEFEGVVTGSFSRSGASRRGVPKQSLGTRGHGWEAYRCLEWPER